MEKTTAVGWAHECPYLITSPGKWDHIAGGYLISAATAKKINLGRIGFSIRAMAYPLNEEEDAVIGKRELVNFLIGARY